MKYSGSTSCFSRQQFFFSRRSALTAARSHNRQPIQHQLNENMIHKINQNLVDDAANLLVAEGKKESAEGKKKPAKSRASKNGSKVARNQPGLILAEKEVVRPEVTITNGTYLDLPMKMFEGIKASIKGLRPMTQGQRKARVLKDSNGKAKVRYYNGSGKSAANLTKLLMDNMPAGIVKFGDDEAVSVHLTFHHKLPQRPAGKKVGDPYDKKVDLDNLQKLIFDAMSGIFYGDDSKVCSVTADKVYDDFDGTTVFIMKK